MLFYLDIPLKVTALYTKNKDLAQACERLRSSIVNNSVELKDVVQVLSEYILNIEDAKLFRKYFSNILLAIVSIKIPLKPVFSKQRYQECCDSEKWLHLEHSVVLSMLSEHPDILKYTLKYFNINPVPPFEVFIHHNESYNVAPKKRRVQDSRQKISDSHIVTCCYTLINKFPNEFCMKWDWSNFITNFGCNTDSEIRWMVKQCMIILTNMTEAQSKCLATKMNLNEDESLRYLLKSDKQDKEIHDAVETISDLDLKAASIVNIDGILLTIYDKDNVQNGNLVPVKSTINNLRSLALAVASGKPMCLLGPVGSGKTSLVEYLAAITGRKQVAFKKVQLGDQTDSRMLLGSHQCTDIPGEFVWRPGVLTEAVQNGHWLLLEDIDCAALDVASTLSSLLERNVLTVPGYRDSLPVTPGFQLFVTQRTLVTNYGFQKKTSGSSALLQKHLTQINVEPLSRNELAEVIQTLHPALTTISSRMIEVFMMFSVGSHDTSLQSTDTKSDTEHTNISVMRGSRLISTRDLLKWCARAVVGFDVTSPESAIKVLQDALDVFTCSVASPDDRLELSKKIGLCLGVVETKSEFYCKHYKPNVSLNPSTLEVGRAKVPRKEKSLESMDFDAKEVVFSFTRQSACLLERIACCVMSNEPVLLVGETGTGKTSSVQYIARQTGHKLVVININQQSDSADLLGGYKPVDLKYLIKPIRYEFEDIFKSFYNVEKNKKFLNHIHTCYETENWTALLALMKQSHKAAVSRLKSEKCEIKLSRWLAFESKLVKLEQQIKTSSKLTFSFIEGSLVKAMQEGHWVLLDEINLASAEILECLAGLLEDKSETIDLLEKGDKVPIKRHPDFTLFACMNPATDVGKKDLPVGLRNRFTEFFIDELTERNDLMLLIGDYLYHMNLSGSVLEAIYYFYAGIKKAAKLELIDGSGNAPHYSLRTLCRALMAAAKAKCGTVSRSIYEAFCLSFLTQLDSSSHPKVEAMIAKAVMGKKNIKSVLSQMIPEPQVPGQTFLLFENHWIPQGSLDVMIPEDYILTPAVRKNLRDIARIISLGRLPVLLQGDTSVGKTSLITYIAKASGNYCVRINNHEHTDLQEYIGSYASDASGKLVFKEGILVEAMRKGYWIILDELNLAPSDVLEALNRVLDDNRELFIPETQQVVKADPNFMLFATQNPPGLYGGRKMLSRAFRNRFVELHFDEIPRKELETILHQRCHIPPTYSKKMIAVMADLQLRRRGSAAVQGKDGFITLRDLFRWGQRYKLASKDILTNDKFYDWDQHIADEGYIILAGKVRQPDERSVIEEVIEKHIKRKVDQNNLFSLHSSTSPVTKTTLELLLNNPLEEFSHIVWTYNMRRLAVLIAKCFSFNEPVLLVGETGCGKTTICQVLAALRKRDLLTVNCHMHTESSDFLGGLRPVRQYKNDGRLFEWVDGPLVKAMEKGAMFLADEISLADDSVLERMNSLLEPERQLVLAERGLDSSDIVVIDAAENFHFVGTMNPGGDFGKKELSPALRNRFTEIWCDTVSSRSDLNDVLERSVNKGLSLGNQEDGSSGIGNSILDFTDWLKNSEVTNKFPFSIRDLLSWVQFINTTVAKELLDTPEAYVHGACMTFLDCFGTALTGHVDVETLKLLRHNAINFLLNQITTNGNEYTDTLRNMLSDKHNNFVAETNETKFGIKPFYIETGSRTKNVIDNTFTFTAPTTGTNTLRLLRGLQLNKAILLEGNPGVGKTSLVTALAKASGHKVVRINLSDQTDITDLFGTDLPSEDGSFTFKEGSFLSGLQNGDWILLDELNLAPQPVLEGLNACLDHRGEVFIPELGKTFKVKKQTRIFACQNPLKQGGARRGLPVSFLNRFTQVYVDTLTEQDLKFIVESQYPSLSKDVLFRIVKFNCKVAHEITNLQLWAHRGGPWEINLRDIQRWCDALVEDQTTGFDVCPGKFVDMLYINRMRTNEDKVKMAQYYDEVFCPEYPRSHSNPQFDINEKYIIIGDVSLERNTQNTSLNRRAVESNMLILRNQLPTLKALAQGVKMNWLNILVGPTSTGKSCLVQVLADLTGNNLQVVPVTSAMDVSDLLGGFEQTDYNRNLEVIYDKVEKITIQSVRNIWLTQNSQSWNTNRLLNKLYYYKTLYSDSGKKDGPNLEIQNFNEKIELLLSHCNKVVEFNKGDNDIVNTLKGIINDLRKLKTKVQKTSSINVGGKFEWIDSLLVKTLMEGSWLLLDNVNLTSAAVLDRLNGLLETHGLLSIPERGEMCDLVPHPNFRVFFTMDPKHGEISRAMRNRGVEVFLLRPDEIDLKLSDTMPYLDLVALLSSCGMPKDYHKLCIDAHELMTSFIQGLERPTVLNLLQATYLTWQQIVRGIPHKTALINSFSDVYIKPRCGGDFASLITSSLAEMKNSMFISLQEVIDNFQLEANELNESTSHTLSVRGLSQDSSFEIAKQNACVVIEQCIDIETDYMPYYLSSIFVAYQRTPTDSLNALYNILKDQLQDVSTVSTVCSSFNDFAYNFLRKYTNFSTYIRFYPEYNKISEAQICHSNAKFLLLYHEFWKLSFGITEEKFTSLDYSKAVLSGTLTDDFVEYPILKYAKTYLTLCEQFIENTIQNIENYLSDQSTCTLMQLLNWRHRFVKVCSVPIFVLAKDNKTPILKEEIVPLLYMHCRWMQKHLLEELKKLLPANSSLIKDFNKNLKNMMLHLDVKNTILTKLSKKVKKLFEHPKLYQNENEYKIGQLKLDLYNKITLDYAQPIESQMQKVFIDIEIYKTTDLAKDVPNLEVLKDVEEILDKSINKIKIDKLGFEQRLMPINHYVLQRVLILLKSSIFNIVVKLNTNYYNKDDLTLQIEFEEILSKLIDTAKVTKGFPPMLLTTLNLMKQISGESVDLQSLSSLPFEFWNAFYRNMTFSPSTYPIPFLNNKSITDEEDLELISNTKRFSNDIPLLPYYVQNLTATSIDKEQQPILIYEKVSLQDREDYSTQLRVVSNIVWKNLASLNTAATYKLKSEIYLEMKKYEQLICYINFALQPSNGNKTFSSELYSETFGLLSQMFLNDDQTFINLITETNNVYTSLSHSLELLNDPKERDLTKIQTSILSLLTSLLTVRLMAEISDVDHVEKYRLKIDYIEEDVAIFDTLLSSYYMCGLISGTITSTETFEKASDIDSECYGTGSPTRQNLIKVHPYCEILLELKDRTFESINKYASGNTFRPTDIPYCNFAKDCKHFLRSVLSSKTLRDLASNAQTALNLLILVLRKEGQKGSELHRARTVSKEITSWLYSVDSFYKKIGTAYLNAFPDLAKPLQASLSQLIFSVTKLNDLIEQFLVRNEKESMLSDVVKDLLLYPNCIPKEDRETYLNRFISSKFMKLIKNSSDSTAAFDQDVLDVLKMNLTEMKMYCYSTESVDSASLDVVTKTLDMIVKFWEKQQKEIEQKKQDDEALYVTKSKCEDEDDEAVIHEEIKEMFPSYLDSDFAEFKAPTLEQKQLPSATENKDKYKPLIVSDDISLVYNWHSKFVRNMTTAEWLTAPNKLTTFDSTSALLQRHPIFSRLIQNGWEALDADIEGSISPTLIVLISQIKEKVDGNDSVEKEDFYRSPWVSETIQCLPLLNQVKEKTNELLDQWPDFPTLKDIMLIVNRILSFSVTSPISRFLTGLELLRDKIEEWNKNAHKSNNMIDISLAVGQQIVNWRKLEMSHWKESLNNLYIRKQSEAHKYWFFLYSVINQYLNEEDSESGPVLAERIVSVLRDFMERSNFAEFEVRLDVIYAYHCHLVHLNKSPRRDELLAILWNMHNYYSQFSATISNHIKEKRAPIDKKLRDFVKICSWDRDLSYWSVKDTVEKAHKALHKHTKEFEKVLLEPVSQYLVDNLNEGNDHVGVWDRPKRTVTATGGAYMIDAQNYIVLARNIKKFLDQSEVESELISSTSLLLKVPSLLSKAKQLCKNTISNSAYPTLVQALDDFVTMVIETNNHLGSLDVEASAPKEKQTSQAKSILQQKRKALSDLFRYLSKIGLNYRTGLVIVSATEELYDYKIAPVDLDAAMSYLKNRRCDASMSLLWSGCEKYFQKNIVRHKQLTSALLTPHQDLGIQNIERCKGFAAQLLKITNTQKKSISKYSRHLCELRTLTSSIAAALETETDTNIASIKHRLEILFKCYGHISLVLEQYIVLLNSCPEKNLSFEYEPDFDSVLSNSPIVRCFKNSDEWRYLYNIIKSHITLANKHKSAIMKVQCTIPRVIGTDISLPVVSQTHIDVINEAKSSLDNMKDSMNSVLDEYQFKFKTSKEDTPNHPILRAIVSISEYLSKSLIELNECERPNDDSMEDQTDLGTKLLNESEDVVATMLLIIQSIYKRHLPVDTSKENIDVLDAIDEIIEGNDGKENTDDSKEFLEDNHLKEHLQEKLSIDTRMLQLDRLNAKLYSLLVNYVQYVAVYSNDTMKTAVSRVVPILEQTVLFVQYFITQKVAVHRVSCKMLSVLLKIFSDLAAKGFCKPSDIDMEEGDGESGPGKMSAGTGLGEGEGQKDVSDRIENQDQLDDAYRPGEEKKEEDRDCKEEEKGVNMTDDFDSHLQDVDKKDADESDQEDDNEDPDKQMGETDNAAEKLDQQIWGSEDEEDVDEESQKNDKDEKGSGESTGEKEMAAKQEEKGTDDGTEGKEKKKKKDINEMEEPEMDDDQVDPYHGNHEPLPEPEEFDLPDNIDIDDEGQDKDGETETENPFEIDVTKDNIPEEEEEDKKEKNNEGLEVSSDEEDADGNDKNDETEEKANEDDEQGESPEDKTEETENEKEDNEEATENALDDEGNPEETNKDDQEKQEEDNDEKEELPRNPDGINEEDQVEEKREDPVPQTNPSNDDQASAEKAENSEANKGTNDNVETNPDIDKDDEAAPFEQAQEQVGDDRQASGRSQLDKSDHGHRGQKQAANKSSSTDQKQNKKENKPGHTEQERTLGDVNQKKKKRSHMLNAEKEEDATEDGAENDEDGEKDADAYQHVKQSKKDDVQAIDSATKEQADQQPTLQKDDEDAEALKDDEEVPMEVDDDELEIMKSEKELNSEKTTDKSDKEDDKSGKKQDGGDDPTGETGIEVEGDNVMTTTVPRGNENTYHTRLQVTQEQATDISLREYIDFRAWLQNPSIASSTSTVWRTLWQNTAVQARSLTERLRLVLEPTGRSRRAGDFRTGRAINMRRVIPYIASHFRKDRIWLRRTKPAKREYKIAIAIDDSSSMADNKSKEMAFESLALVSQALNLLESGDLAVLSFGEQPNLLHPFTEQFSEHSGGKILERLRFEQNKTKIAQLLDFCTVLFEEQAVRSDALNAKLLVVVSDGRGIYSEGETRVIQSVRRARQQGIFLVYVIIDNPDNKDSIMDIRRPLFDPVTNSLNGFASYLDTFPFPFYLILRDMTMLPTVLGDALRQWFELAANTT